VFSWAPSGYFRDRTGRVPDGGPIDEAMLAWHSGKPLIPYKPDVRSMLGGFETIGD
jgi:hypothetical protein